VKQKNSLIETPTTASHPHNPPTNSEKRRGSDKVKNKIKNG
jgi:hypothetical protein